MLDFSRLQTPLEHGDVLIEPPVERMAALAEANHALVRSYSFGVLDCDVGEIRKSLRRLLCEGCDGPTVLTGHQPEFIHAGVWAKHVVAADVARALGGKAINLIVDSDVPKETVLRVPSVADSRVRAEAIRFADPVLGVACECIPALDRKEGQRIESAVRRLMGERYHESCMPQYLAAMVGADDAGGWVDQMVLARRVVESGFGVEMIEHRVSRVWFGPLLADLILDGERFAECYNAALAEYRSAYKVRSANRPIPDLIRTGGRLELPVWVYRLGEARRRLFVQRASGAVYLYADAERFGEVSDGDLRRWERAKAVLENQGGYLFRPRALGLTLWARVLVGDLFIHGIGGAKYDRITDGIIRRYYGVEPPGMGCVSATLMVDVPRAEAAAAAVRRARTSLRDVRYNPQRYVKRTPESNELINQRAAAVSESVGLKTRSPGDRQRRRAAFERIGELNARLLGSDASVISEAEAALRDARVRAEHDQEARRRDYFFAMLKRGDLQRLRERLAWAPAFRL